MIGGHVSEGDKKSRIAALRSRDFRRFYIGYLTSLIGNSMSFVAIPFAVLGSGGSATDLGYVITAQIVPNVAFMLGGGVAADLLGRRRVMLSADILRSCAQATLAAALLTGRPHLWVFVTLAALVGTGNAFFTPGLNALTTEIAPASDLVSANALLGIGQSAARIAGPAIAGILVAAGNPGIVIALDAASYAVSVAALSLLRVPPSKTQAARTPLLAEISVGWAEYRGRAWLLAITTQFALFNLITWAPYLVLGPVVAKEYLGGARAWGIVVAGYGAGAIAGGLAALGRKPSRPVVVATLATLGYPVVNAILAAHGGLAEVTAAAAVAGAGSAVFNTFETTAMQQQVPTDRLARVASFVTFGAYLSGALGLVLAGRVAALLGAHQVLGAGAVWSLLSTLVVLALPCTRAVRWRELAQAAG